MADSLNDREQKNLESRILPTTTDSVFTQKRLPVQWALLELRLRIIERKGVKKWGHGAMESKHHYGFKIWQCLCITKDVVFSNWSSRQITMQAVSFQHILFFFFTSHLLLTSPSQAVDATHAPESDTSQTLGFMSLLLPGLCQGEKVFPSTEK